MRAKQFLYVCTGILMLIIAHAIGATRVQSQTGSAVAGFAAFGTTADSGLWVVLQNGDVLHSSTGSSWSQRGNVFGTPVQAEGTSITDVKKKFKEEE